MTTQKYSATALGADINPVRYWLHRLLVGNPFYLVSAALLLYGIYRISGEAYYADKETSQMIFNFSALQIYEGLLVLTALFLARRRIWYDATLLVVLETAFVLLPFLLVSQAGFIGNSIAYLMCGGTLLLAALKFSALKKSFPELNLPPALLAIGAVVAGVNCSLPLLFKAIIDLNQALLIVNLQEAWLRLMLIGILPLLAAAGILLPRRFGPDELPPQKRWLPELVFAIWVLATAVHVYAERYVQRLPVELSCFVPALWVLAWTSSNKLLSAPNARRQPAAMFLLALPVVLALPLLLPGVAGLKWLLLGCNLAAYVGIYFRNRRNAVAFQLVLVTLACMVVEAAMVLFPADFRNATAVPWLVLCGMVWVVAASLFSRSPKAGIGGAISAGVLVGMVCHRHDAAAQIGIQVMLGFLIAHSLAWYDHYYAGAKVLRVMVAALWVAHSFAWGGSQSLISLLLPFAFALGVAAAYLVLVWLYKQPVSRMVLWAAIAVGATAPGRYFVEKLRTTSTGTLLVAASFLLFAVGTWLAVNRHKLTFGHAQSAPDAPPKAD